MDNNEITVNLASLIHKGGIFYDVEGETPQEIYSNFSKMIELPEDMTSEDVCKALCAREEVLSTAVGNGIALPHARTPIMNSPDSQKICILYLKKPINMNAPDEREVSVMFVLLTHNSQIHLKVLSLLAGLFTSVKFKKALENKAGEAELATLINELA